MVDISKDNVRKVQIFVHKEWRDIPPLGIKQGMVFRLFEPDGTPVSDGTQTDFVATKDSYLNKDGIVITFGYHSVSMGNKRGFTQKKILLLSHGGAIHDTIAIIEEIK